MPMTGSPPPTNLYDAYVCVRDKKTQDHGGGTFTSGAWRTRDITEEQADTAGICSIDSNQITLAAGTYRCLISCPAFEVDRHQAMLYSVTDSAVLLVGTVEYAAALYDSITRSFVAGRFTLAAEKALEVRHQCGATRTPHGFGVNANFTDEIYTVAEFFREA